MRTLCDFRPMGIHWSYRCLASVDKSVHGLQDKYAACRINLLTRRQEQMKLGRIRGRRMSATGCNARVRTKFTFSFRCSGV